SALQTAHLPCYSFFPRSPPPLFPTSFPTRRSSDLAVADRQGHGGAGLGQGPGRLDADARGGAGDDGVHAGQVVVGDHLMGGGEGDRKSTRLNSSHDQNSYAVFCLKKKKLDDEPSPL